MYHFDGFIDSTSNYNNERLYLSMVDEHQQGITELRQTKMLQKSLKFSSMQLLTLWFMDGTMAASISWQQLQQEATVKMRFKC